MPHQLWELSAMYHNKPVWARDISVLREIGGNFVTFFLDTSTESLMNDIEFWLAKIAIGQMPHSAPQHTWQDSAHELLIRLGPGQTALAQPHHGQVCLALARGMA